MNCIHEEKAFAGKHHQALDGVQDLHTSQQNPSPAWKIDEIGQAERQFTADIRLRRSNQEGSPHRGLFRASSPNDFQSNLVNQRAFHNVLQGMEMDTPHPDANFIELPKETLCPFLMRMTVNTFAVPLGLSSQAQLWGALSDSFLMDSALGGRVGIPNAIQWFFWTISLVLLFVIGVLYMAKACLYWGAVKREWAHPVRSSFALTPILTAMTLLAGEPRFISEALHPNTPVPLPAFLVLGGLMLYLQMSLYGKWLFEENTSLKKANPSYQIAVVGNFLLASLGTQVVGDEMVQIACEEITLVFFSVGILYQLMVFMAIQQSSASHIMQSAQKYKKKPRKTKSNSEMSKIDKGHEGGLPAARKGDTERRERGQQQGEVLQNPSRSSPIPLQRPRVGIDVVEKGELASGIRHLEDVDGASDTITMSSFGSNPRFVTTPNESTTEEGPANDQWQRSTEHASEIQTITTISSRNMSHQNSERLPPSASSPTAIPAPQAVLINTKLHPIYFLMVAPPAAASIAWSRILGEFDKLARSLFFISAFLYMFIAIFNSSFLRNAPFSIAWWAYTFPSSTFALAALMYSEALDIKGVARAAFALALLSTLMVLVVFLKTVFAALRGKLFPRDPVVGVCLLHASD